MEKIRAFFSGIKIKFNNTLEGIDKNVSPESGKKMHSILKAVNYIWILAVLPIIILCFAAALNINTTKNFDAAEVQGKPTQIVKNVEVDAGASVALANVSVSFNEVPMDNVFSGDESGTSMNITNSFDITDTDHQDITLGAEDGLAIFATPNQVGAGVDYTNYEIIAQNKTDTTYLLNMTTNTTPFVELEEGESVTISVLNIDSSWIESELAVSAVIATMAIWFVIWVVILSGKWYFKKWQYHVGGGK